jgi:hypothetical protein
VRNVSGEGRPWKEIHKLGEQRLAGVHKWLRVSYHRNSPRTPFCRSNRHHPSSLGNPRQSWLSEICPFVLTGQQCYWTVKQ